MRDEVAVTCHITVTHAQPVRPPTLPVFLCLRLPVPASRYNDEWLQAPFNYASSAKRQEQWELAYAVWRRPTAFLATI